MQDSLRCGVLVHTPVFGSYASLYMFLLFIAAALFLPLPTPALGSLGPCSSFTTGLCCRMPSEVRCVCSHFGKGFYFSWKTSFFGVVAHSAEWGSKAAMYDVVKSSASRRGT